MSRSVTNTEEDGDAALTGGALAPERERDAARLPEKKGRRGRAAGLAGRALGRNGWAARYAAVGVPGRGAGWASARFFPGASPLSLFIFFLFYFPKLSFEEDF